MFVRTDWDFGAEGAKFTNIYEGTSNFTKFHRKRNAERDDNFSEIHRIEEAPGPMLAGIELFQHRFSGNPENPCFFLKSVKLICFQVPRFRIIFGDFFSKSFASRCS